MSPTMTLSDRFDKIDASRVVVKPVFNTGAAQRRDDVDTRRKIGRQTQIEARRQGVTNVKPAMRAAQARATAPRQQLSQQPLQRQTFNQGRGQGRGFRAGRAGPKPIGMPPRNNSNSNNNNTSQRNLGKGPPMRGSGGRSAIRGSSGRGGGRGPAGRADRGRGKSGGRGSDNSAFVKLRKDVDLDEGLDEYWFKAGKGPDPKVASLDRSLDNYWSTGNKEKSDGAEQKTSTGGIVSDAAEPSEGADGIDPDL